MSGQPSGEDPPSNQQPPSLPEQDGGTGVDDTNIDNVSSSVTTKKFADEYDNLVQQYGRDYVKRIVEVAKKDTFTITLNVPDPSGKTEPDPIDPEQMRDVYVGTEQKTYKRRPISAQDYHRAEKLRAKFQSEKDPDKVADNQSRIYQFLAFCYLGMSPTEFKRVADWTEIRQVIDGCNHRTLYQPGTH